MINKSTQQISKGSGLLSKTKAGFVMLILPLILSCSGVVLLKWISFHIRTETIFLTFRGAPYMKVNVMEKNGWCKGKNVAALCLLEITQHFSNTALKKNNSIKAEDGEQPVRRSERQSDPVFIHRFLVLSAQNLHQSWQQHLLRVCKKKTQHGKKKTQLATHYLRLVICLQLSPHHRRAMLPSFPQPFSTSGM